MYASTLSLISLLILHRLVASATEVQAVLGGAASQYGYNGPGVYQIYSYTSSLPIGTAPDNGIVSLSSTPADDVSRWLIANVSKTEVMIINNATGQDISATTVQQQAVAKLAPPYLPAGRWVVDIDSEYYPADPLKRPIGFNSTLFSGHCLDLTNEITTVGNPIIVFTYKAPPASPRKNQVWYLECVEDQCQQS